MSPSGPLARCSRRTLLRLLLTGVVILPATLAAQTLDADLIAKARAIHERLLTIETHNDINPAYSPPPAVTRSG